MTNPFKKRSTLSTCLIFFTATISAQTTNPKYEVGLNAGLFIYQGDLTPSQFGSFKTPTANIGISGSRYLSNTLSARLDLAYGKLKADESKYKTPEWRQQRNFAFKSPVNELIASIVYHPIGRERKISPYLFTGVGYTFLKITRDYSRYNAAYFSNEEGANEGLNMDLAHSLPKAVAILPVGLGLRYRITEKLSFGSEASYRIMSTDYLDGFSQSANPGKNDHYYKYSIGLFHSLGGKNKYGCPVVKL